MTLLNETIKHAVLADAAAAGSALALNRVLQERLFATIQRELDRRGANLITQTDLSFIAGVISLEEPELRAQAQAIATTLIDAVANSTTASFIQGMQGSGVTLGRADRLALADTATTWIADNSNYAGKPWEAWADKLAVDSLTASRKALRIGVEEGTSPEDTSLEIDAVAGRASQAADTLTTSLVTHVSNGVRETLADTRSEIVGYLFAAVLDLKTSSMCRGLSGNVYSKGRKDLPRPPLHPNCRSHLVPLTQAEFAQLSDEQLQTTELTPAELNQAVNEGRVIKPTGEDRRNTDLLVQMGKGPDASIPSFKVAGYEEWLRMQTEAVQRELLGPTRFEAWKNGMPLSSFATSRRALNLAQLNSLYPGDL